MNIEIELQEKNDFLDDIANSIHSYSEFIIRIEGHLYKNANIIQDSAPFINFRDALVHYRKMYECDTDNEFLKQYNAIIEHLNRGIKDSILYFIQEIGKKYNRFSDNYIYLQYSNEDKNILRMILHKFKQISLVIRTSGINLEALLDNCMDVFKKLSLCWQELIKFIKDKNIEEVFFKKQK